MPNRAGATSGSSSTTTPETELRAVPAGPVRVLLAEHIAAVGIGSSKPFRVVDARGKARRLSPGTQNLVAVKVNRLRLPLRAVPGGAPLQLGGKAYRGELIVHPEAGKLTIVNRLPLDRYLRGVVPREVPDDWPREALRAQAVVTRTYALATLKPGTLFDLHADARSQVYGGIAAKLPPRTVPWARPRAAFLLERADRDHVLPLDLGWKDSSHRGGVAASDARAVSRLRRQSINHLSKFHRWTPTGSTPAALGRKLGVGVVRGLVVSRGPSGRVAEVTIKGRTGNRTMVAEEFQAALGLRST